MNKALAVTATLVLMCMAGIAQANVFNLGPGLTNLETVTVGDAGNAGERSGGGFPRICGSVDYTYNIGKYEVTAAQYCDFLNKVAKTDTYGLFSTSMDAHYNPFGCNIRRSGSSGSYSYSVALDWANRPVNFVSYWDACRFANWLGNGQPSGLQDVSTTERGAYTLNGYNGTDGRTIQRNTGTTWAAASEDEWYKAAYYKGGGTDAGYWDYPTGSDTAPSRDMADASGNNANYNASDSYPLDPGKYTTVAGEFQNSDSPYGTFDQGGNVWEWNETIINGSARGLRGGSFFNSETYLQASYRSTYGAYNPTFEDCYSGFRVSAVPEPSSIMALAGGLVSLLGIRRRRA